MSIDRRSFLGLATGLAAAGLGPALPAHAATVAAPLRRTIPGTTEALPVIGMGTADTFNVGAAPDERKPLAEVMGLLLQTEGSVIDTAPSYGSAEAVTGDLLRAANARNRVFLATKISAQSGAPAQAQWERSLADLHVDKVDLLQIHNLIDWQGNLRWLRQLKEQGRIRYLGITHYRDDAHEALEKNRARRAGGLCPGQLFGGRASCRAHAAAAVRGARRGSTGQSAVPGRAPVPRGQGPSRAAMGRRH
ncbi:hypothetical protein J2T05_000218 [Cupriavidus necator]|nr:hypothetical protein [Cupriavidus necator]